MENHHSPLKLFSSFKNIKLIYFQSFWLTLKMLIINKYMKITYNKTLWNNSKLWIKTPNLFVLGKNIKNNEEHSWETHKSSMNIFHPKPSQNHLNLREITYNQTRVHRGSKSHLKNNLTRQTRTQKITL